MRLNLPLLALAAIVAAAPAPAQPVAVPAFRSVELTGGGTITLRQGSVQRVTLVRGSTDFTGLRVDRQGKLRIAACRVRCPRKYDLRIEIVSPRAPDVAISGGGEIRASGFSRQGQLSAAINGGGRIDVRAVPASSVSAAVNGGGAILVRPLSHLAAAVRGGGEIAYTGNPHVSQAVAGGGSVRRIR